MATDRYSDDHKIIVGNGGGELTVDAALTVVGNISATGDLDLNTGDILINSDNISIENSIDISIQNSGVVTINSVGNINISSDLDLNIESSNTIIDSSYINLKSAVIKADSTISTQKSIERSTTQSKSVFIPGELFIPDPVSGTNLQPSVGGGYISSVDSGTARYQIPFIIPNGSIITSITMYCKLYSEFDELRLYLNKYSFATISSPATDMAVLTSDSSTLGVLQAVTDTSILNNEIDYSLASYYLRLSISYSTGPEVRLYGVHINYSTKNIAA